MRQSVKSTLLFLLLSLLPIFCFAQGFQGGFHFSAQLISFSHFALLVCACFAIKQYFWPGFSIRLPFHIFNLVFVVLFYSISLTFLVNHLEYYPEFTKMTPLGVIATVFFNPSFNCLTQWVILFSGVINVLYIRKYREDYFSIGIPEAREKPEPVAVVTPAAVAEIPAEVHVQHEEPQEVAEVDIYQSLFADSVAD